MNGTIIQERIPVVPRSVKGRFRTIKTAILLFAYSVYFFLPWLPWQRNVGPDQAILFNIVDRHFYIFNLVVYAQDIFWLAGLLLIAALLLFLITAILGRVFCGYFCFQTLWTDVFIFIERLVQGERNARIKLLNSNWNSHKISKTLLTHLLWILMSLVTGLTFTLYWGYAPELIVQLFTGNAPFAAYATTLFLATTTYFMAGLAREQTCTYMCPYARFQSAMFDKNTLTVTYDQSRGERAKGRQKPRAGMTDHDVRIEHKVGDCIDCGYCVQVCPTGIDIRDGMQYECITCALCIDACDTIMQKIDYPTGLIRYSSEVIDEGKPTSWLRLNVIGYALITLLTIVLLSWSIITRDQLELIVLKVRQPLSVTLSDGREQNRYEIKINNKTSTALEFNIKIEGLEESELTIGDFDRYVVNAQSSVRIQAKVRQHPQFAKAARQSFRFVVEPEQRPDLKDLIWTSVFSIPESRMKNKEAGR
ncbi:MAG: cytochrome c oxidase accessory protein CcoG [Gammaproteobacteria bacterium]